MSETAGVSQPDAIQKALKSFEKRGGMLRMAEAVRLGIHRNTLYRMVEENLVERISRGLYRLADAEPLGNPDLVTVAAKVPDGVICLISALAFHNLTTQIPHEVYLAIARNSEPPRIDYPPIRTFRFSGKAFTEGIERPLVDGIRVPIYCREKTIADCFKFRNQIGLDTALEAIKFYKDQPQRNVGSLLDYASVCRVSKIIRPYLEALL
jgi:predicted transcriptional regulator of viral defense system